MIKKAGEVTNKKKHVFIIQGLPGTGKTTLALSAPNPILIDCDGNSHKVELEHIFGKGHLVFNSYKEIVKDLKSEELKNYDTIIFDTIGAMINYIKTHIIQQNPKNAQTDGVSLAPKGWGVLKREFTNLIDYCRYTLQKDIIIVAHVKEQKKNEEYKYYMDVEGSSDRFIEQASDLMCMMQSIAGKRIIGFTPTEYYNAKSAYGIKGEIEVPKLSPGKPNNFITNLFQRIDNYIAESAEKLKQMTSEYNNAIKEVKELVKGVNDIKSIQKVLEEFNKINFPYDSKREAWTLLKERSKEIGFKYNHETRSFEVIK